jgi:hypothetical protein
MRATYLLASVAALMIAGCSCSETHAGATSTSDGLPANSEANDVQASEPSDSQLLAYGERQTREALEDELKDGDSAKYKEVAAYHVPKLGPGYAFCGKVNAKNSFGAYNGYERFVGVPGQVFLESEVSDFDTVWKAMCDERQRGPAIWW